MFVGLPPPPASETTATLDAVTRSMRRRGLDGRCGGYGPGMSLLWIILIVVALLALGVLGAVVKGLLWLTAIAAIIFVVGAIFGYFRFKDSSRA